MSFESTDNHSLIAPFIRRTTWVISRRSCPMFRGLPSTRLANSTGASQCTGSCRPPSFDTIQMPRVATKPRITCAVTQFTAQSSLSGGVLRIFFTSSFWARVATYFPLFIELPVSLASHQTRFRLSSLQRGVLLIEKLSHSFPHHFGHRNVSSLRFVYKPFQLFVELVRH